MDFLWGTNLKTKKKGLRAFAGGVMSRKIEIARA